MKKIWTWIWTNAKQIEILLLLFTVVFSFIAVIVSHKAYNSAQEQLWVMREQLESDRTFEKMQFLADHYNQSLLSQPIFKDYLKNNQFGNSYKDPDIRSFIDEFEYVKAIRDILKYQDKTLWIFYRRVLLDACKNKQIKDLAIRESKSGFLNLCGLTDSMK